MKPELMLKYKNFLGFRGDEDIPEVEILIEREYERAKKTGNYFDIDAVLKILSVDKAK